MGEVWSATDTNLGRQVAIKVLPEAFASDAERLARFEREAKTLGSLNHPNIAAIYGLERTGPIRALVMELVGGPTLAERIAHGLIPFDEALPMAKQIAEALEAAHEQGIIHRDLKPANVKVREDGTIKVLDFGLAKATGNAVAMSSRDSMSPTITTPAMTQAGIILGTAAYMSPEQAKGRPADKRSDVWAFGCVLYEMLTGRRAFDGEDMTEVLGAVVRLEPDWQALPHETPPAIRTLLQRCLVKDRRGRIGDIAAARFVLEHQAAAAPATEAAAAARPRSGWRAAAVAAGALAIAALSGGLGWWVSRPRPELPMHPSIALPDGWQLASRRSSVLASTIPLAVSPDGRRVALLAGRGNTLDVSILVYDFGTGDTQPLEGTASATSVFWAPDGRAIGFITNNSTLKKATLDGAPPRELAKAEGIIAGGTWNRDGTIVVAQVALGRRGLKQVPSEGGVLRDAVPPDPEEIRAMPWFLPDGRHLLYTAYPGAQEAGGARPVSVYVGALDSAERVKLVEADARNVQYADGHVLYMRGDTLMALPFDAARRMPTGDARPVARDVLRIGVPPADGRFSASDNGVLVYLNGQAGEEDASQLAWVDRKGNILERLGTPWPYRDIALAPDGRRAAAVVSNELRLVDLAHGVPTRLTSRPVRNPVWDRSTRLAFVAATANGTGVFVINADGTGERPIVEGEGGAAVLPASWSDDGRFLLLVRGTGPLSNNDVLVLPLEGKHGPVPLLHSERNETRPRFSPDGRWIAYTSTESDGTPALHVARFIAPPRGETPTASSLRNGRRISVGGGTLARWSDDGRELVYVDPSTSTLMAASVDGRGEEFLVRSVEELFTLPRHDSSVASLYDLSRDGKRLLVTLPVEASSAAAPQPPTVVLNWSEELKRLVPTN